MTYACIMVINMQICVLSDFITLGNRELLFHSHNAVELRRGQPVRFSMFSRRHLNPVRFGTLGPAKG